MYNRASRFSNVLTRTPGQVGPASYLLYDTFDNISTRIENPAPFNSTQIRNTSFDNKSVAANPSPNKYKICFRKGRIVGGSSLQNKAPRMKYKSSYSSCGPYAVMKRNRAPGKLHVGVPPRGDMARVTSVPEKGVKGYEITSQGPVKIYHPPENRAIGAAEYYNPEGHKNFTTLKYKGNFWSLRTAHRFRYKGEEGPSPAEYTVGQPSASQWQKNGSILQIMDKAQAPQLRTLDIMQLNLCRENFPGPAQYSPKDPNFKKCECGEKGTFGKAKRKSLCKAEMGPGPADYVDTRSALHKSAFHTKSPFNVTADRFLKSNERSLPGPSDYKLQTDMWTEIQKKGHSKYSKWDAPFDSSAVRKMSFANPDSGCAPSPDWYYPQFQKKGDGNKSSMFASKAPRSTLTHAQASPGPATYSVTDSFKTVSTKKSHLHTTNSSFLTSGHRLKPLDMSSSPAPTTYNLPTSTLSSAGRSFGVDDSRRGLDITPGPADYKINPEYARSSVFNTHNITLQPRERNMKIYIQTGPKKLRCFSKKKYVTGHCSMGY